MQVPKRQSEQRRKHDGDGDHHLTAAAIEDMRKEIDRLEQRSRPKALEDLTRAREMGDLSENAAYSEAKGRLRGIDTRLLHLKDRIKNAVLIEPGPDARGRVRIGAAVTIETGDRRKTYRITGSQETDPNLGRISHTSPLGAALIGHKTDDVVTIVVAGKSVTYRIIEIR